MKHTEGLDAVLDEVGVYRNDENLSVQLDDREAELPKIREHRTVALCTPDRLI